MTAFIPHERELTNSDLIRFTNNDYKAGLINGDLATVVSIDAKANRLLVEKNDGSRIDMAIDKPLYLEHGYCQTVHAAQGQTCERILIDAPAISATSNESSYYVAISRATSKATLYTDDRERLPESLNRENTKTAALDISALNLQTIDRDSFGIDMS